jgi:hypothetical protein
MRGGGVCALAAVVLCLVLIGCGSAKVSGQRQGGTAPTVGLTVIYVADFALDTQHLKPKATLLPPPVSRNRAEKTCMRA